MPTSPAPVIPIPIPGPRGVACTVGAAAQASQDAAPGAARRTERLPRAADKALECGRPGSVCRLDEGPGGHPGSVVLLTALAERVATDDRAPASPRGRSKG